MPSVWWFSSSWKFGTQLWSWIPSIVRSYTYFSHMNEYNEKYILCNLLIWLSLFEAICQPYSDARVKCALQYILYIRANRRDFLFVAQKWTTHVRQIFFQVLSPPLLYIFSSLSILTILMGCLTNTLFGFWWYSVWV